MKRIKQIRKSLKVAEGQRSLKNLEGGGKGLKMVKEIPRRWMNEFDPTIRCRKLRELEESRKSLRNKRGSRRWKNAAGRRRDGRSADAEWE
jgi:hypothetical protein